jgi:uncharacterized membrane protein YccC
MLGWFRRWPAYALNGVSVSVGVGLVQLSTRALSGAAFAQYATLGAVLASLPHLTGRAAPTFRRCLAGGVLAILALLLVTSTAPHPSLRGLAIALIVFVALLSMAWGTRAAPIVFAIILGVIFSLARPTSEALGAIALASLSGVGSYSCWAFWNARLLEPRFRTLSVVDTLEGAGALLVARAAVLSQAAAEPESEGADSVRFSQVSEEVRLAQSLQSARDLVFPAASRPDGSTQVALIGRVAELREIVLTSRLDLDLLGHDHAARFVRARLALGLRKLGAVLFELARAAQDSAALEVGSLPTDLPDLMEASHLLENDPRARLLPLVAARLRHVSEEIEAIRRLLQEGSERTSLRPEDLSQFVTDHDTWPLSVVSEHLSLASPVLRHAFRCALAMTSVYFFAYALPWATRPYWMLLSVAVVLRGTFDDTLSRRNARVLGTAIGCVTVAVLVPLVSAHWLEVVFVAAVGVAHAFVNVRYLLTASAGTVMALLQAHFAVPTMAPLIVERLLDTVIGAAFAWGFCYVLPSWERRTLPVALGRALYALRAYAKVALDWGTPRSGLRLARQRAYDALGVVAAALQRSAAEPRHVRPPTQALVTTLEHAQRLMAHLSSLRSLLDHRGEGLPPAETGVALSVASQAIGSGLSLDLRSHEREPENPRATEPPLSSAEVAPLPWLMRRLDACVYDAGATGIAAQEATRQLAQLTTSPRALDGTRPDYSGAAPRGRVR